MNSKTLKRQRDLKNKLMAAISMLLVSSIMLVTSTYAWFTLSTAPEVTGITTAVGANGNLEMALLPTDGLVKGVGQDYGITANVGDSAQVASVKNITWGNLVDLSDNTFYGLDKLTLNPSALHVATWDNETTKLNPTGIVTATILSTPTYGADGRVSAMADNTTTSTYVASSSSFPQNTFNGVRAVGTASGMTDRQLAYRNYRSSASTAMAQAKTFASQSLNVNGAALADIALAHGVNDEAKHSNNDVYALLAIVDDLLGTESKTGVLQYIEKAYKDYIIAYAASAANASMDDNAFKAFQSTMEGKKTIDEVITFLGEQSIEMQDPIRTAMSALKTTKQSVAEAKESLSGLISGDNNDDKHITWSDLSTPLYKLADTNAMKINGYAASTVKENMSAIVNGVASQGVTVTISTGGGVYADVADHCGDYNAQITIKKVEYNGLVLENMNARMETNTTVDNSTTATPAGYGDVYLGLLNTVVTNAGEPAGTGQTMPITDYFGYIIDLAFKTNAAESNLLLQTTPADRIYDQEGNESTMGHGATMTFTSTTTDFTADQLAELMDAIRIVFFEPGSGAVYATAKLDMAENAYTVVGGNTITANIYLYENADSATTYRLATAGETATHVADETYRPKLDTEQGTHKLDGESYVEATGDEATHVAVTTYRLATADESATHIAETVAGGSVMVKDQKDAVITALTQNTAKAVSVLVYLDGNYVTNADVAATAGTSMTGSMNLQFSSSANLTPMNYTPLMKQTGTSTESVTSYNVTVPTGVTGAATATANTDYTFTVTDGYTLGTVTVGGTEVTPTTGSNSSYTIPAASVTGDIVITVTN